MNAWDYLTKSNQAAAELQKRADVGNGLEIPEISQIQTVLSRASVFVTRPGGEGPVAVTAIGLTPEGDIVVEAKRKGIPFSWLLLALGIAALLTLSFFVGRLTGVVDAGPEQLDPVATSVAVSDSSEFDRGMAAGVEYQEWFCDHEVTP